MRFFQTLEAGKYVYETEDVFGTIVLKSERPLTPQSLDDIVSGILRSGANEGTITDWISFTFAKRSPWDESEDEDTGVRTPDPKNITNPPSVNLKNEIRKGRPVEKLPALIIRIWNSLKRS